NKEDDGSTLQHSIQGIQAFADAGATSLGSESEQVADHGQDVRASFLRRPVTLRSFGEQEQTDFVVVAQRREGQQGGGLRGDLLLEFRRAAEELGTGEITGEDDRQFSLVLMFADVQTARPRCHVPIERTDIVSRYVLAHLGELHASSFKDAEILAAERLIDEPVGPDLDAPDLGQYFLRDHGTSTFSKMLLR